MFFLLETCRLEHNFDVHLYFQNGTRVSGGVLEDVFSWQTIFCCCRFLSCVTTTQKFSSSDPTCAILNFVGAECLCAFVPLSIPMDVIVCLTITYIASELRRHCNFVQTTF